MKCETTPTSTYSAKATHVWVEDICVLHITPPSILGWMKTGTCDVSPSHCFRPRNASQLENASLYFLNITICWQISHGKFMKQLFYYNILERVVHDNTATSVSPYKFVSWMGTLTIEGPDKALDGEETTQIVYHGGINMIVLYWVPPKCWSSKYILHGRRKMF